MEWTADVSAGDRIRERLDAGPLTASMHSVVPRGFPAYARVFHAPFVTWVDGGPLPSDDELREMPMERWPEMHSAPTTWADTAAAFGTRMHATAQWGALVRHSSDPNGWQHVPGPDGRRYDAPEGGRLDGDVLAGIAALLAPHTTTPDDVYAALWEGSGGLVGFFGSTPAVAELRGDDGDPGLEERHRSMLERSIHDPFNNVFRKPVWQPGILSDEVSRGARLHLPDRDHILFRGTIAELADPQWPAHVPWGASEAAWTESPSLLWPADLAWVLVTEVDFDTTIIGGDAELIAQLCAAPGWEALPLAEGAALTWDADRENV